MICAILSDPECVPSVPSRFRRWAPETAEAADTLRAADLPPEMAEATAQVLAFWEQDEGQCDLPVKDVLAQFRSGKSMWTGPDNKQGPGR
ncbi:DUF1932 domain-containing protein [Streptomyces cyaneofuscatus]|uniref:DUF1932 domain-containing protein n=1 Tax=Streptomyces cyaneofuscatus TaxID=66883 RepID=A0ABZ1EXM6_9ACTN|nr:DUF1932 domain-containing protein [Streptomyces cyaneofuscatus]WSB08704.1 DUF1932 domain-containing protein [Streptomyces cyaneofuscatus]WSD47762.1 DUF1932 domain-containing protein [Streptomyces cyaneofuscatus]